MKKFFLTQLFTLTLCAAFCQDQKSPLDLPFDVLLKKCGLTFTMPKGFKETKVQKFESGLYQYAIKHKSGFEVRYYIKPYSVFFQNDTSEFARNPNQWTKNFFISTNLNVSGAVLPNIPEMDEFPKEGVKAEFGGDYGLTTAFPPKSDFGKGFEMCATFVVRKNDVGEFMAFFMFTNKDQEPLQQQSFLSMKFKK
jgi:hypothetical protein